MKGFDTSTGSAVRKSRNPHSLGLRVFIGSILALCSFATAEGRSTGWIPHDDIAIRSHNAALLQEANVRGNFAGWYHDRLTELMRAESLRDVPIRSLRMQRGAIEGRITDSATGEPLPGATIQLAGASLGTAADQAGEYQLAGVPAGDQVFRVAYLGYQTEEVEATILEEQTVRRDIELNPDVLEGDEIVVYSQASGQAEAIRRQLNSSTIINVVSEARLRELPDPNVADAVGRMPGVYTVRSAGEGQKVAIRGLGPKYSSITVDGVRVSSSEDDRSVDLTMIAPDMLTGVEIYKALRPDMDGDAIGGSVNLSFAGAPSENQFRVSLESGYHDHIGSIGNYKGTVGGSSRFFSDRLGVMGTLSLQRVDRGSHSFSAGYRIIRDAREGEEHAPVGVSNLTFADRDQIRDRYGAGLSLDLEIPGGKLFMNSFMSRIYREQVTITRGYSLTSVNQSWSINDTETRIDAISNSLRGEHSLGGLEFDWQVAASFSRNDQPYSNRLNFTESSALDMDKVDITMGPENVPDAAYNNLENAFLSSLSHPTSEAGERNLTAMLNTELPVQVGNWLSGSIKFGGKHYNKHRWSENQDYNIIAVAVQRLRNNDLDFDWEVTPDGQTSALPFFDMDYNPRNFLDGDFEMDIGIKRHAARGVWERNRNKSNVYNDQWPTARFNDQDATERITAAYGMSEVNIGPRLTLLGGIRYERDHSDYNAITGDVFSTPQFDWQFEHVDTSAARNIDSWLPMVHLRFQFSDRLDIRLARTESISRPTFSQVNPRLRIDLNGESVQRGVTGLLPETAVNYDLFLTGNSNRLGLVAIGGFYKQVEGLIYNRTAVVIDPEAIGLPEVTNRFSISEPVSNPNVTTVYGFEAEWQSHLLWLPRPFSGLVINANYTRTFSETQYGEVVFVRGPQGIAPVDTFRVGRMPYQADHIANITLGYDYKGFSGRVSMLFQGETLSSIGSRPENDSFTEDYLRFDATLRQNVLSGTSLFVNLHNITNRADRANRFTGDFPTSRVTYGWSMDMGVRFQL